MNVGPERTAAQDIAFGLRQLTDVTNKALSPGINDPTTAVHALGHISGLLCQALDYELGPRLLRDDEGRVRVILQRPDFGTLLDSAIAQPRRFGKDSPSVLLRIAELLREVGWCARDDTQRGSDPRTSGPPSGHLHQWFLGRGGDRGVERSDPPCPSRIDEQLVTQLPAVLPTRRPARCGLEISTERKHMPDADNINNTATDLAGKAKEVAGKVTRNEDLEIDG